MNRLILFLWIAFFFSCEKNDAEIDFEENTVDITTHHLQTYSVSKNSKYLIVFESGLGDDHSPWIKKKIPGKVSSSADVLLYDRAGYGKSTIDNSDRGIEVLRAELDSVIKFHSGTGKIILVGHSLGGMIIRDYAVKNPTKVAALLFVDPSHENYNQPGQTDEDQIYDYFNNANGPNFGGTREARQLIEDSDYMATVGNMPDVPVIVITSMKTDANHNTADRQNWYNAHELLATGISDFTHVTTTSAGHYIQLEQPDLVIENIRTLIGKLP